MMTSQEIRKRFLDFFAKRDHAILASASLITDDNPKETNATLFNTAGMQSLIPYLLGKDHPEGQRLVSSQKCVRTVDLDEVGDNTHLSFFEMLGNWSLGDYFKEDAIRFSWEFLTDPDEGLGLDPQRIYVTVFAGNDIVPRDTEAVEIWKHYLPEQRIYFRSAEDNWWTAGPDSPAGPSTEMFYDLQGNLGDLSPEAFEQADEDQQIIEIWNNVFMTFRQEKGEIVGELPRKNIDTGAGLERVTAVVQGVSHVFDTDLFKPLLDIIKASSSSYQEREARIVADHIKTAVFLLQDGIAVSNTGRGYVLRRMLRRAYLALENLGSSAAIVPDLVHAVVGIYGDLYFADSDERALALKIKVIAVEMDKIIGILNRARSIFLKLKDSNTVIDGAFLAELEQTQGIPFSVSEKMAEQLGLQMSKEARADYFRLKEEHQARSRKGASSKFKGGLAEDTPKIRALHTATHLMLAGLRKYLGPNIRQMGSNITEERTRFDLNYDTKIPEEILSQVEEYVNDAVARGAQMGVQLCDKKEAQENPDIVGSFWERYPDMVKVWTLEGSDGTIYSRELCGGPHVKDLSEIAEIGRFRIVKEESSSQGVRRIKAVLE